MEGRPHLPICCDCATVHFEDQAPTPLPQGRRNGVAVIQVMTRKKISFTEVDERLHK
jgi:hypothetical protein